MQELFDAVVSIAYYSWHKTIVQQGHYLIIQLLQRFLQRPSAVLHVSHLQELVPQVDEQEVPGGEEEFDEQIHSLHNLCSAAKLVQL